MPTQTFIRRLDDGTGKLIDAVTLPSAQVREVFAGGDADVDAAVVKVTNADPAETVYGWAVRAVRGSRTVKHFVSAGSNNATSLKGTAGKVYAVHVYNTAAYDVYLKLYNKATAPAPATDTALLIATIGCQAGLPRDYFFDTAGANFSTGIGYAVVKGIADADNTSVLASDCTAQIEYL